MQIAEIFRGKVVDVTKRAVIIEVTGTTEKIEAFETHGAAVRADRDDAHGRDRHLAGAQRDLAVPRRAARTRDRAARRSRSAAPSGAPGRAGCGAPLRRARRSGGTQTLATLSCALAGDVDPAAVACASRRDGRALVPLRAARPRRRGHGGARRGVELRRAGPSASPSVARALARAGASAVGEPGRAAARRRAAGRRRLRVRARRRLGAALGAASRPRR